MATNTRSSTKKQQSEQQDNHEVFHDSNTEFEGITLEFLYQQLTAFRSELSNEIISAKDDIIVQLQKENHLLKEEVESINRTLVTKAEEITALKDDIIHLKVSSVPKKEYHDLERDVGELQQYIRRNNIEICGIPDDVDNSTLEDTVIKIAKAVDIRLQKSDIEACHRLFRKKNQPGPKKTIVRFTNRKNCELLLRSNKRFANTATQEKAGMNNRIYINSNLCSYYKFLMEAFINTGYLMEP